MISTIILLAIVVGAGWYLWSRRGRYHTQAASPSSQGVAPETLALEAFAHGNTCLAEGRFEEAITAFQRARELDPKRPHVAARLAEVERRQQAATPPPTSA
ncbi:MAG TPA: tetratricopeptide repeat protein [Alphaproteobacteria bacterium]|nr:tetratricopeptide repeat protein [Alphaproteobacteria bacterium]